MSRAVTVRAVGRFSVEFTGPGIIPACTELSIPRMRAKPGAKGWLVPENRSDELMRHLERGQLRVEVTL